MEKPAPRDCREEYKITATLYLKRRRQLLYVFCAVFVSTVLSLVFQAPVVGALCVGLAMIVLLAGILFYVPRLRCPACSGPLERAPETYCPECGKPALKHPKFLGSPRCTACTKRLAQGRGGRRYKVRFCQQCGSHVHEARL